MSLPAIWIDAVRRHGRYDIHERALTDKVSRKLIEIGGENANVLLDDGPHRGVVFFRCMSCGDHVTIPQVKPGSPDGDFPGFLRGALILGILQDADCGLFSMQKRILAEWRRFCAECASEYRHACPCC